MIAPPCSVRPGRRTLLAALTVATILFGAATPDARSKKADLSSTWRAGDTIVIDGVNDEWQGRLLPLKDVPISVAFYNDSEFLYFCLTTSDRAVRSEIDRQGLTVWFDQEGGKKKAFGVEYPLGMPGMTLIERRGDTGEPGIAERPVDADQDRLAILGPGKNDRETYRLDEVAGIQAKVGEANGVLVYEMKIPLRKSERAATAIGTAAGAILGVGLETPEIQRPANRPAIGAEGGGRRGPGGGGGWGGGIGGRGGYGGAGGRPGGREPGEHREMPKPLKQWVTVQLAAPAH